MAGEVGVVVAADVGVHLVALEERSQSVRIIQDFPWPVPAHRHRIQRQVTNGDAQGGRLGRFAGEAALHPGKLLRRQAAGRRIPDEIKNILLGKGVIEGKLGAIDKGQARIVLGRIPVGGG